MFPPSYEQSLLGIVIGGTIESLIRTATIRGNISRLRV